MGKVSGSYESVIRGVSQQVPQDRREGQHWEQINMVSDPVRGLARRHGSVLQDEVAITGATPFDDLVADTANHHTISFWVDGVEHDLVYRTGPSTAGNGTFCWALNRSTNKFLPVVLGSGANMAALLSGGVSGIANVGRYLYIAGNTITPTYTTTDRVAPTAAKAVIWVRGGAFSRTFKVTVTKADNSKVEASYKTVSSSYPGTLDTSDLLTSDADYQKKVNDRVYAYNTQVTQWIGTSAEDITPENIAGKLRDDLAAKGITGCTVKEGTVLIDNADVSSLEVSDGGDNSLIRAVDSEVTNAELVSVIHWVGKVVKVKPQHSDGGDALYLQAFAKDNVSTGWTGVSWKECAGVQFQPTSVFCMATVLDGTLYVASGPSELEALTSIDVPGYEPNTVGDDLSCPVPTLFGKTIDYLGLFQDRLVIGSGATLFFTRPGDYLNLWRQSVLTVEDNDPWEGYALGAENDTIRYSVMQDRDLVLYGKKFQYVVAGRVPLTPRTAAIISSSDYKDATDAQPKALGNFVFYAKYGLDEDGSYKTSLHQVGLGSVAESTDSYEASQQLDDYLVGKPVELVPLANPNFILLRSDGDRHGVAIYTYLDAPGSGERLFDSWSKWAWLEGVGYTVGMSPLQGTAILYMLRQRNGIAYMAAERFSLAPSLSRLPYADSLRPYSDPLTGIDGAIVALANDGGPHALKGMPYENLADFEAMYPTELSRAWVGFPADAYVTPTNPFMRDRYDKVILSGRLTLSQVRITVANTGGLEGYVTYGGVETRTLDFSGRIVSATGLVAGETSIANMTLPMTIGREVRECQYRLKAKTWLPLSITNIEWTGQVFNNTRRV